MNSIKKYFSIGFLIIISVITNCFAFAGEQLDTELPEPDGQFEFVESNKRIDSSGNFTYDFYTYLASTKFKLKEGKTSTTIKFYDNGSVGSGTVTATFYKNSTIGSGTKLGSTTLRNGSGTLTVSNLNSNDTYYFTLSNSDPNAALLGYRTVGYGTVSNMK